MSKVNFISDLHLGHKNILKFSPERGGTDCQSHAEWLVEQWNSVVGKNDLTWVLGDVCFDKAFLPYLKKMNGSKHLIMGNHDTFSVEEYSKYFNKIQGLMKYKGFWLSHCPLHSSHLRGIFNIHGHLHNNFVSNELKHKDRTIGRLQDLRYFNVCVEPLNGVPVDFQVLKELAFFRRERGILED